MHFLIIRLGFRNLLTASLSNLRVVRRMARQSGWVHNFGRMVIKPGPCARLRANGRIEFVTNYIVTRSKKETHPRNPLGQRTPRTASGQALTDTDESDAAAIMEPSVKVRWAESAAAQAYCCLSVRVVGSLGDAYCNIIF